MKLEDQVKSDLMLNTMKDKGVIVTYKDEFNQWCCSYKGRITVMAETEADARGKMRTYLKEDRTNDVSFL